MPTPTTCHHCGKPKKYYCVKYCSHTCYTQATRGVKHSLSRRWYFQDPNNRLHIVTNLCHFIRQNAHLFDPADLAHSNVRLSKAYNGLAHLRPSTTKRPTLNVWKGWTWAALTEAAD